MTATRIFTLKDSRAFAQLSGEQSSVPPLSSMAESTSFGKPVVPPLLVTSLFWALIANELSISPVTVVGEMLKFLRPVYVGETVTATVEILSVNEERKLAQVATRAASARGFCIDGEAVVSFGGSASLTAAG